MISYAVSKRENCLSKLEAPAFYQWRGQRDQNIYEEVMHTTREYGYWKFANKFLHVVCFSDWNAVYTADLLTIYLTYKSAQHVGDSRQHVGPIGWADLSPTNWKVW